MVAPTTTTAWLLNATYHRPVIRARSCNACSSVRSVAVSMRSNEMPINPWACANRVAPEDHHGIAGYAQDAPCDHSRPGYACAALVVLGRIAPTVFYVLGVEDGLSVLHPKKTWQISEAFSTGNHDASVDSLAQKLGLGFSERHGALSSQVTQSPEPGYSMAWLHLWHRQKCSCTKAKVQVEPCPAASHWVAVEVAH